MKLVHLGAISTGVVILLSIALIVPALTYNPIPRQKMILSFNINENVDGNLPDWCYQLSEVFRSHDLKATVFVTGKVADEFPQCVSLFSNQTTIDIGSRTYGYVNLVAIEDYSQALLEVRRGKIAVDKAGQIDSKLFKAPYGSTDDNIYSLLNRSGIAADFSYQYQYNLHNNEQFIKFDLESYNWADKPSGFNEYRSERSVPIEVNIDNSISIEEIEQFVSELIGQNEIELVNASELTGSDLTIRSRQF